MGTTVSIPCLNTLQFAMRNSVDQKANYCALEGHLGPIVAASATGDHSHLRGNRRQTSVSAVLQATVLKLIIMLQYCSLMTFYHHTRDSDDEDEDVTVDARHYSIYSLP